MLRISLCLPGILALAASAQTPYGTILGSVHDPAGGLVQRAAITIRNTETGALRHAVTYDLGSYGVTALPVGTYDVTCETLGFKLAEVQGVALAVDQRARVDVVMELGDVRQTVEVMDTAPLLETDTASQGTVITNEHILELPLNGRNFQQLATLGPGSLAGPPGAPSSFSVGGTRGTGNSFILDGTSNTNVNGNSTYIDPSIDLVQEFKVQRNTFAAEYGRGGAQINVVTKSGTNQLHVTLFEFLRNDQIQARNFFDLAGKPALRRNQFGGTVGGPVVLPRYNGQNKTFWLFNYEGVRQRTPNTILAAVPTLTQLTGNLSSQPGAIMDPLSHAPFPNKQIPVSRFDPTTLRFLPYMPQTDAPLGSAGTGVNFIRPVSSLADSDQFTTRLDHQFSRDGSGFVRYSQQYNALTLPSVLPSYDAVRPSNAQNMVLGFSHVIRPNLINEFRWGFSRFNLQNSAATAQSVGVDYAEQLGFNNLLSRTNDTANSLPAVGIVGFSTLGGAASQLITQRTDTFSFVDNLTWVEGRHTWKAGADIRLLHFDVRNINYTQGAFSFQPVFTGNALGDFLLGIPRSAAGTAPPGIEGENRSTLWQWFVQDDWRVTPTLTLNLGLRWEYAQPYVNTQNRISIFDPTFPGGRLIYPGDTEYFVPGQGFTPTDLPLAPRGLYPPDKSNFAPRFGFAWHPAGSNHWSLRGGYGIYYDEPNDNNNIFLIANPPDLTVNTILNDPRLPPARPWSQLFPSGVSAGTATVQSVARNLPTGYIQQWSFDLERELGRNSLVELGYIGTKGTKLDQRRWLNQAVLDQNPGQPTSILSRTPYPAFANALDFYDHTGFSNYHALAARAEHRFSAGLTFLASYTYSKSIDNSSYAGTIGAQPSEPQDTYNLQAERSLSFFDSPHRFVASLIYRLPFGAQHALLKRGVENWVLGGWEVTTIMQYQTGTPESILVPGDPANVGVGSERAEVVGNPFPQGFDRGGAARRAFDTIAFAMPAAGTFGNSGRNIIRDAPINNWDAGLSKEFPLERARLQVRAEAFNALNHTQFQLFGNVLGTPAFGVWNSARSPRILQFGLKLYY